MTAGIELTRGGIRNTKFDLIILLIGVLCTALGDNGHCLLSSYSLNNDDAIGDYLTHQVT